MTDPDPRLPALRALLADLGQIPITFEFVFLTTTSTPSGGAA